MKFLEFDESRDFPFYNHNPRISKLGWFVLLLSVPIAYMAYLVTSELFESDIIGSILFVLIMLIPLLYYSNWDYSLMFRKPTKNEIILGCLMFIGYMIYSLSIGAVLDMYGLSGVVSSDTAGITVESTVGLIFSMMGEELLKFIPLMFFMRVVYKFSSNLKLSVVISTIIVLFGFAMLHYAPPTNTIISVLVLQGVGSLFEVYGYIKTKNLFVPYISHLLTDAFSFILILMGI